MKEINARYNTYSVITCQNQLTSESSYNDLTSGIITLAHNLGRIPMLLNVQAFVNSSKIFNLWQGAPMYNGTLMVQDYNGNVSGLISSCPVYLVTGSGSFVCSIIEVTERTITINVNINNISDIPYIWILLYLR